MFHKLLDVFISAIIFILGLAFMYVLMSYALSKLYYTVITPSGYPLSVEYQKELYYRDYGVLYLHDKAPFQNADGFQISGSSDWVNDYTYFTVSNYYEKDSKITVQGAPDNAFDLINYPVFGRADTNYAPGQPYIEDNKNLYKYAEFYPMFADPDTSGYFMQFFTPTLAPYKREYTDEVLKKLKDNNIISTSTIFIMIDEKEHSENVLSHAERSDTLGKLFFSGLKYSYAPLMITGYTQSDSFYNPSFYVITGQYNNKDIALKVVSMQRKEIQGGNKRRLTLYLWYDKKVGEWKPLVFGAPNYEDTVAVLPTVYSTFYTVSVMELNSQIEYKVMSKTEIDYSNYRTKFGSKLIGKYDVVGNPVFSIDENGNLVVLPDNPVFRIYIYSYPHASDKTITYKTEVKSNTYTDFSDFADKLNKLNAH